MSASPGGSENLQTNLDSKQTEINSLKTQTQTNTTSIAANVNAINTQKSRIDNLAHLEEGSTTGDAELIDARIDNDGNSFTNIGNNIRNTQEILNYTLINAIDITPETYQYILYTNGRVASHTSKIYATDYIPCIAGGRIIGINVFSKKSDSRGLAFYDKNKTYISNSGMSYDNDMFNNNFVVLTIPQDACYMRATINTDVQRTKGKFISIPNFENLARTQDIISESEILSLIAEKRIMN